VPLSAPVQTACGHSLRERLDVNILSVNATAWFSRFNRVGRQLAHTLVFILTTSCSGAGMSDGQQVSLNALAPTPEHRQEIAAILQLMQRYHYKRVPVNDQLSEEIFDRFLESLDPQQTATDLRYF